MLALRGWLAILSALAAMFVATDPLEIFSSALLVRLAAGCVFWAGVGLAMLEFGIRIAFASGEEIIDRVIAFVIGVVGGLCFLLIPVWALIESGRMGSYGGPLLLGIAFYVVVIRAPFGDTSTRSGRGRSGERRE